MAADIEKLAEQFRQDYPNMADLLQSTADIARALRVPETFSSESADEKIENKTYPEISLIEEHRRQSIILANCFAKKLDMTKQEYMASLPQFLERPENYAELGLTLPLIVETRLPWRAAADASKLFLQDSIYVRSWSKTVCKEIHDWDNYKMPTVPFSAWVQDGTKFVSVRPKEVREELLLPENRDYRGGRILDAISFLIAYPGRVDKLHWDVIGSAVVEDFGVNSYVPSIRHNFGSKLDTNNISCIDYPSAALVLGRKTSV